MDTKNSHHWPFADPPNAASITVRQIIQGGEPILLIVHDNDDGGWQFLTGGSFDTADAMLVSLQSIIRHDPSIADLVDLPLGWAASRAAVGQPWQRQRAE